LKQTQSAWVDAKDVRLQERKAHLLKRRAGTSLIAQSQRIHLLLATAGMSGAAADCQARRDRERGGEAASHRLQRRRRRSSIIFAMQAEPHHHRHHHRLALGVAKAKTAPRFSSNLPKKGLIM
jgi:hypothetical protein